MAVDNSSVDQFERWITFSPSQQPSVSPGNKSFGVKEGPLLNSSSIHTTSIAPSVDSTCNSPDKEHTGCITPSSPFLNQKRHLVDNFIPSVDYPFASGTPLWLDPTLSPTLDPSQTLLNDDFRCESKTELNTGNPGPLSVTQKKRREQNRAAQRNFRQRKEIHLKHLEATIISAEARRSSLQQDNDYLQRQLARLNTENDRLRRGPSCYRRDCAMGRKYNQGFSNAGSRPQDKSKVERVQVDKGRGTSEGVLTSETEKNGQFDAEADNQREPSSVKPATGSGPMSEKRPSLHIAIAQQSNMDHDSSRSSTNSSTNTNSSTSSSYTDNINSTKTKSRTSSISSIDSTTNGTLTNVGLCESCDRLRISKEKCNNSNESSSGNAKRDTNTNTYNADSASQERDDKRILIGAQEALQHIQSHELFHRGLVDIEYLLCALRRAARYYKGAAVFDRAELELAVEESAMEGRSDELI